MDIKFLIKLKKFQKKNTLQCHDKGKLVDISNHFFFVNILYDNSSPIDRRVILYFIPSSYRKRKSKVICNQNKNSLFYKFTCFIILFIIIIIFYYFQTSKKCELTIYFIASAK